MTREAIADRIREERRKHGNMAWAGIAASKIAAESRESSGGPSPHGKDVLWAIEGSKYPGWETDDAWYAEAAGDVARLYE